MKNAALPAILFTALAAAAHHDHAQVHHKRNYYTNTKTVTELTTFLKVVTLSGPLPAGATAYSPEEIAELTKEHAKPAQPSPLPAVDYNTVPQFSTSLPQVAPPEKTVKPQAAAPVEPKPEVAAPAQSPVAPVVPPPKPSTTAAAPKPTTKPAEPAPPADTASPSGGGASGGSGGANPYFPNGPKTGEKASGVRLSPFMAYWSGASIENHIGACGKAPYLDTDPALSKSDSKGDKKFMFHPPVISGDKYADIMQYCGAILEVTGPDGLKTTGTVVDLCEDCGGPGGIDMMKASWLDMFKNVADGDCVYGASWVLTGWAKLAPALRR